jgi:membrane-associated protease RseP (regulator of RpoE activity)
MRSRRRYIVAACMLASAAGGCQGAFAEGPATILSPSGGVPANLISTSVGQQHWFGVAVENLPEAYARQLKLQDRQGLMVMAVLPQSPAERAGLRKNDLLIEIDGKPLTSQKELAQAANALEETKNGVIPKVSHIVFLREGERSAVDIMPEARPGSLTVIGGNLSSFTGALPGQRGADAEEVRNYVLPNGAAAQIGPGYRVNLDAGDTVAVKSIRGIMSQGKAVVLARETDANGVVRNTISVEGKTYVVEAGKLELLPQELRGLGEELLAGAPVAPRGQLAIDLPAADPKVSLEQRVRELESQNAELQKQIQELAAQLKKDHQSAAK